MIDLKNIESFKSKTSVLVFLSIIFLILPGVATLYLFDPELFLSLDWIKLVLLSASITAPFALVNTVMSDVIEPYSGQDKHFIDLVGGIFISGVFIYIVMPASYVLGKTIYQGFGVLIGMEIALMFIGWIKNRGKK